MDGAAERESWFASRTAELVRLGLIFNRGLVAVGSPLGASPGSSTFSSASISPDQIVTDLRRAPISDMARSHCCSHRASPSRVPTLLYGCRSSGRSLRLHGFTLVRQGRRPAPVVRPVHQAIGDSSPASDPVRLRPPVADAPPVRPRHDPHRDRRCSRRRGQRRDQPQVVRSDPAPMARVADGLLRALDLGHRARTTRMAPAGSARRRKRMVKKGDRVALIALGATAVMARAPFTRGRCPGAVVVVPFAVWHAFAQGALHGLRALRIRFRLSERSLEPQDQRDALRQGPGRGAVTSPPSIGATAWPRSRSTPPGAGPADHKIRVPYLERTVAEGLAGLSARRAQELAFRW